MSCRGQDCACFNFHSVGCGGGRGDVRGGAVVGGDSGERPCKGAVLIAGGAPTGSTSMGVGVAGGGVKEGSGVVVMTGGTGAAGVGEEAGGDPAA